MQKCFVMLIGPRMPALFADTGHTTGTKIPAFSGGFHFPVEPVPFPTAGHTGKKRRRPLSVDLCKKVSFRDGKGGIIHPKNNLL